ncbi:hypothetical protein, partial [Desertihabitans aurantiacus]|uniref:hypothetical protein n=1 Tax=Desertihabitans aurantiacus TaxID=2282477 RepID=UPI0018E599C4
MSPDLDPVPGLDPVSRLVLDEAGVGTGGPPGDVLVVDDVGGALCRGVLAAGGRPRAWVDDLREARAAAAAGAELVGGPEPAALVLGRLPTALS